MPLQSIFEQCFQIRTLNNIYICERFIKNPKVTIGWITSKYKNKVTDDSMIAIGILVNNLRTIYRVEVNHQKVYKAKRKILESAAGKDHVETFRQLWGYAYIIKQQRPAL